MRARAWRVAVIVVAAWLMACRGGGGRLDASADDCGNPDGGCCPISGEWCASALVVYSTETGTAALAPGVEGWFLQWYVGEGMTPPAFGELGPFAEAYGYGALVIIDEPYHGGIELGHKCFSDASVPRAVWAKIRGFAPVVTYPVVCNQGDTTQVVAVISAEEDAAQLCPQRPAGGCKVRGTLLTPEGVAPEAEGLVFSSGWPQEGIGMASARLPALRFAYGRFEAEPGTIVFVVPGFLPQIHCLPCGEYTFTL